MHGHGRYTSSRSANKLSINDITKDMRHFVMSTRDDLPTGKGGRKLRSSPEMQAAFDEAMDEFEVEGQRFEYIKYPNQLGGFRWYFRCPGCKQQSLNLYKPVLEPQKPQIYMCEKCQDLKTPSALYGPTKKYCEVLRPMRQMELIRKKLKSSKRLTDNEVRSLMEEHDRIKTEMERSPVYIRMRFDLENNGVGARNIF